MLEPDSCVLALSRWSEVFLHQSMRHFLRYAKENGLSMSQIGALFRVFHHGSTPVSEIGEELGVTNAAASQMLDKLVQQGLIFRSEDPSDRRVKQIALTGKGRQVVRESIQARQAWVQELAATLSPDEREQVVSALDILILKARLFEPITQPRP